MIGIADEGGAEVEIDIEVTADVDGATDVDAGARTVIDGPYAAAHAELDALEGVPVGERTAVLERVNRLIADELADLDGL